MPLFFPRRLSFCFTFILVALATESYSQKDSLNSKLSVSADFRFRVEQDWNSRKSDGSIRDDRTRFRYRARVGLNYSLNEFTSFGIRIRTGNPAKQQDPQLTVGAGKEEFGTVPIGFEKLFFEAKSDLGSLWVGKNTFPFKKNNELFWSDNVFPEGLFGNLRYGLSGSVLSEVSARLGHFISSTNNMLLTDDSYFQVAQLHALFWEERVQLFPGIYRFKKMPNIPDGNESFFLDYTIIHAGLSATTGGKKRLGLEIDFYHNLESYNEHDSIPLSLRGQKNGFIIGVKYGGLKKKSDLVCKISYAYLQRFSAVDFFAQNDWARWDYSAEGSPDGRLTNLQGIEFVLGYVLTEKLTLKAKGYLVEQLVPYGSHRETNNRVRLDLDIKI